MGKRSGFPETDNDIAALSISELNKYISQLELRAMSLKLSASLHKSAMQALARLEIQREKLHGIPAPRRKRF
jgi:hypothetical protein